MKRYIREVFIPEYAKNFNKGLSEADIKFYGKIHFGRSRSDNKLNMHCHLIISRKDQANKKKLSPLTNHKNTKKGAIAGGFDRIALFENVEKGFDKLFDYNRQLSETFKYCNIMKNGSITDKLQIQEGKLNAFKQNFVDENEKTINIQTNENVKVQINTKLRTTSDISIQQEIDTTVQHPTSEGGLSSLFSILPLVTENNSIDKQPPSKSKKKRSENQD